MLCGTVYLQLLTASSQCHCISFKIISSPTLLLPRWRETVTGTDFKDRILPRDISTRWNSTFDMLSAFIEMKQFVVQFLDQASNGLSEYNLEEEECKAASDLVKALTVRVHLPLSHH